MPRSLFIAVALLALTGASLPASAADEAIAWPSWRGPQQNGTTLETNLPDRWVVDGVNHQWTYPLAGRGTPAIAGGRVYALGYDGESADLQEVLVCLDEANGRRIWEVRFNDFLSDSIYGRYAIGAPAVDPRTGNVYVLTTPGLLNCVSPDGRLLWQHSMMEEFGRLTFPNGRTGAPVVDGDLVITRGITSSWGPLGPARDRFYAFKAKTGELVWVSTPGTGPKDSSFSNPVLSWRNGRRVLYAGTGCGNIVCVDASTGAPQWRFAMSIGGVNSAVVLDGDQLIAIHGRENLGRSIIGGMVALPLDRVPATGEPLVLGAADEIWRNELGAFTSSPVLVGNRLYQTVTTGDLACVDTTTGSVLWHEKLGPDQLHASPVFGDGKLYVPMTNGSFYIIKPTDAGPEILSQVQLDGNCLGAPAIAGGRVYVHSTDRLYCFGRSGGTTPSATPSRVATAAGLTQTMLCAPSELLVQAGDRAQLSLWNIDAAGATGGPVRDVRWTIPDALEVDVSPRGALTVDPDAAPAAAVITAAADGRAAAVRVRIVPDLPYTETFEGMPLRPHPSEADTMFGFPPSAWIGARLKWEVREHDGGHVLAKTLDRALFQRATAFFGAPDQHDYTMQVDIMSDGNRRTMSTAGVINQRYLIALKGNHQEIEISSNMERIKHNVPFRWRPHVWYRLKSRVDVQNDGSAIVRAKVWPRDQAEPTAWNTEFTHRIGHTHGAPGLFGFAPQSRFRVYVDNITVTPND